MAIFVTGDWHGGGQWNHERLDSWSWPEGQDLDKSDYLIILGDVGLYWTHSASELHERVWLDAAPWTTLFIDGNHEGFPELYALPIESWNGGETSVIPDTGLRWLRRGQYFDIDGATIFTMGGAWSIDADWREEGDDWWPEEIPSQEELDLGERNLASHGWKADYVLTHDCPHRYLEEITADSPFGDIQHTDRLEEWLDMVDDRLDFEHWYFGHHHEDFDVDDLHTCVMNHVIQIA